MPSEVIQTTFGNYSIISSAKTVGEKDLPPVLHLGTGQHIADHDVDAGGPIHGKAEEFQGSPDSARYGQADQKHCTTHYQWADHIL